MAKALQRRKTLGPELFLYCFNVAIFMYFHVCICGIEHCACAWNCIFVTIEYLSEYQCDSGFAHESTGNSC